jgi:DNA-binding CsgD family transcriptional regulator/tetratricopeptide (TPR) repeat protein
LLDLPAPLRVPSPFSFVGRSAELEKLRVLLPRAEGEGRRVVLVGGEPGSGKSRLAREFAAEAARGGALVLYGACDAVVRTPYGPFAQALDRLVSVIDPVELMDALGITGGELTRLLPDLSARVPDLRSPPTADPDTERHRLHSAVVDLLDAVSRRTPILLVVEDGHWADAPTLLLLRHLAQTTWSGRVLLFATFRDTEADVPEGLALTLADLRRADDVVRLHLRGLSGEELGEFVRRNASLGQVERADEVAQIAQAIGDLTAGNPFLVCELWRALLDSQVVQLTGDALRVAGPLSDLGSPEGVREVVSERLTRLAPATSDLLELAAAAGGEFDLELLSHGSAIDERQPIAALDEAIASGIIVELPGRRLAYRFTHELVRRAVYDRLSGVRQAELHLRVGEALEARQRRSPRMLADLAYHFAAAVPLGERGRAVEYSILAARAATAALAFDEAGELLRTALELGVDDDLQRAEVLLELGTANHRAGRAVEARQSFEQAAGIARALEDPELLAWAAIGYEDASWRPAIHHGMLPLLEEAATALGDVDSPLRVRVLSGLARALDMIGEPERAAIVRSAAIGLARRLDDRAGLATVLVNAYWSRGTTPIEEILDMLAEARTLSEQLGDTEMQADAMSWLVPAYVAVADIPAARRAVLALREMAEATRQPFMLHVAEHYGAALALSDGRLAEAEAMAHRSERAGRLLTGRDASGTHGIQMFSLRREQGRLAELAPVIRILAGGDRDRGPWRPGYASLLVELGMHDQARRELTKIAHEGLGPFRESLWLASLTYIADAAAAVGDEATAALVYPEMAVLTGTNVMIGHLVATYGAADRYLGMLAATLGEPGLAESHFERALGLNRQMESRTWLAHTAYQYARLLLVWPGADGDRAAQLLAEADHLAESIGMAVLRSRIRALDVPLAAAPPPDGLSGREVEILRLVAHGLSNRDIGASLFISEHTAANHIRSILRKTGCANRTEAASYAHRHALVDAPVRG